MSELLSPLNVSLQDLFRVTIQLPPEIRKLVDNQYVQKDESINDRALHFNIFAPTLPQIERPSKQVEFQGQTYSIASHTVKVDSNITFDFDIDSRFLNYSSVFAWMNIQADQKTVTPDGNAIVNLEGLYKNRQDVQTIYKGRIVIEILDTVHRPVIEYVYEGAFPVTLASPKLTYRATQAQTLGSSVTFSYDKCIMTVKPPRND